MTIAPTGVFQEGAFDRSSSSWIHSFKDVPLNQKPASFSIDQVMEKLTASAQKNH